MINPVKQTITDPKSLDLRVGILNQRLEAGVSWLDSCYGIAEKSEDNIDGRRVVRPMIYVGEANREYLNMLPDSHLGNYSWIDVVDGYEIEWGLGQRYRMRAMCGLVVWYNSETAFVDPANRTNRHGIDDVLGVLNGAAGVNVVRVSESGENIYRGYTIGEAEREALTRPYMAFRIDMELYFLNC